MKYFKTNLGLWAIFSCFLSLQLASAQTPTAAIHDSILLTAEGKVETATAGSADWHLAQTNQILHVGDRLRTGLRSRATVRLSDLTTLRVNALTTLQIQPPAQAGKAATLDVKAGSTYFFSREKPAEMEFRTPLASGAIRGTEFNLAVSDDGQSVVTLIDGEVALSNAQGSVSLLSGEQGRVAGGQAPTKTASLNALNIIQWSLYYPAVLDVDELTLTDAEKQILAPSLAAYRSGELLAALANYPASRAPTSEAEKIYLAGLLLSVGQVEESETQLSAIQSPLAEAIRELVAAVKFQTRPATLNAPFATALLADSYYLQSRSQLDAALKAARAATQKSPNFGFAWTRLAELEFSFGHTADALAALEKGLQLAPRNAEALALKGFLLTAKNKSAEAQSYFESAIAVDGALGNAWLGRGLIRIHQGDATGGLQDLQVAATLEPNRSVLRSYLGKAFANKKDTQRAERELRLAQKLDPNDPTSWLYLALLNQSENKINDAISDLEKSKSLNDNRRVFRSKMLLDQDRAVRSANLAKIYADAGLTDVSVSEASRAVTYDYANYSAHQFLANSYDALRDPKQINLRYETPWLSEQLVAQLLSPVGADNLSLHVSQQEYSRIFETDHYGLSSSTEYRSGGDWFEKGSAYGHVANFSYAFDAEYRTQTGDRPNNDLEQTTYSLKLKQQITPQDSVMLEAQLYDSDFGDVAQYYNQDGTIAGAPAPSATFRASEKQTPNIFLGYHHEWSLGSHTLFFAGRLNDTLQYTDPNAQILFYRYTTSTRDPFSITALPFDINYHRKLEAYTAELQQIYEVGQHTFIAGARYQTSAADTKSEINNPNNFPTLVSLQNINADLQRVSVYAYDQWQLLDSLLLVAGVTYDDLRYPRDIDTSPITSAQTDATKISPKVGLIWMPLPGTHLRGAYTRSLGGVFFDNSFRLEPTQVAGFNQAFRSLIPESIAGLVPGTQFETWGFGLDQVFEKTRTYLTLEANLLRSDAMRTVGVLTNQLFGVPDSISNTRQSLNFEEQTLAVSVNQLLGRDWSLGARYRISDAKLNGRFVDIPGNITGASSVNQNNEAVLQQVNLAANYNNPCGFFSRAEAIWSQQSNRDYTPALGGDDFWQFNLYVGYRFWHRAAQIQLGLLNIADQNYRLNPLNLYNELPRDRTLSVIFNFYF